MVMSSAHILTIIFNLSLGDTWRSDNHTTCNSDKPGGSFCLLLLPCVSVCVCVVRVGLFPMSGGVVVPREKSKTTTTTTTTRTKSDYPATTTAMEKYRLVEEHKGEGDDFLETTSKSEVRITQQGKPRNYISYAMTLFVSFFSFANDFFFILLILSLSVSSLPFSLLSLYLLPWMCVCVYSRMDRIRLC